MQHDGGLARGLAADLPVDAMAVADVEHAVVVRLDLRVRHVTMSPHRPSSARR